MIVFNYKTTTNYNKVWGMNTQSKVRSSNEQA